MKRNTKRKNEGITLIALVITIIVLLILAGVTIATLTGNNGILTKATQAKEKTEEGEEKEKVKLSASGALAKDNGKEIREEYLEEELTSNFGEKGKDYDLEGSGPFTVTITGSGRKYLINTDGTLGELVNREGLKIGDYVNYVPDLNTEGYASEKLNSKITGYSGNTRTINQETLKWRILNIEPNGRVDLISEKPTSQPIYFAGALGYNNSVYIINDICRELYGNQSLGITGDKIRNLTIEDIENQMNEKGKTARNTYISTGKVQYNNTKTYGSGANKYPQIYAEQNGSGINTLEIKRDGIGESEEYYSETTTDTSNIANEGLTVTQTYYYFDNIPSDYFDNSEVYDMIFGIGEYYWLASRYVNCDPTYAFFGMRMIGSEGRIFGDDIFVSGGNSYYAVSSSNGLRPVISLDTDIEIIACTGENSDINMHQLNKK